VYSEVDISKTRYGWEATSTSRMHEIKALLLKGVREEKVLKNPEITYLN